MKFRMDALHYALLAVVVLLVVYCGASFLREGSYFGERALLYPRTTFSRVAPPQSHIIPQVNVGGTDGYA